MRYISLFSGIEAASVAWDALGWSPVAFSEIEPFPSAVLAHHYPQVPNLGDITRVDWSRYRGQADLVVGGSPCQAFSVAGLRKSLDDDRGNLTLTFLEAVDAINPPFIVWENVPGVLNTKDNAFGCFLGGLAGEDHPLVPAGKRWTDAGFVLGPQRTVAWRVLDAQYFGLAQRRRRVFVVACPRNGADPREILFESEGLRRDTAPGREAGKGITHDVAPCLGASGRGFERTGETRGQDPVVAHTLRAEHDASEDGTGRGTPLVPIAFSCKDHGADAGAVSPPLRAMGHHESHANAGGQVAVAVSLRGREGGATAELSGDIATALRSSQGGGDKPHVLATRDVAQSLTSNYGKQPDNSDTAGGPTLAIHGLAVRRLTPREAARLQGFQDDYLDITYRGKPAADGNKYKALGNSMAVPVMRWIGRRIDERRLSLQAAA